VASLNAYFAHRELEKPPSKRKSCKNLQGAANIQWQQYVKKNRITLLQLESTNDVKRKSHAFVYILSIFAGFLLTLLHVSIWSRNVVSPT